jgi:hypothetical protein
MNGWGPSDDPVILDPLTNPLADRFGAVSCLAAKSIRGDAGRDSRFQPRRLAVRLRYEAASEPVATWDGLDPSLRKTHRRRPIPLPKGVQSGAL